MGTDGRGPAPGRSSGALGTWARRRAAPLSATVATLVVGMDYVILWTGLPRGPFGIWLAPSDLWGTYLASVSLVHGHLTSVYAAFPGMVVLMAPVAALGTALHLEVGPEFAAFAAPTGWLLVGPFELLVASTPLFAMDAFAEELGSSRKLRWALAFAEAVILANVTIKWGHPEDALSIGLVLFALLDTSRGRWARAGWLLGFAIAVQPFALLALPAVGAFAVRRGGMRPLADIAVRAVVPAACLLLPALVFDWHQATIWLRDQPNYPTFNHQTPWTAMAPRLPGRAGAVSAGPMRLVAVVVAGAVEVTTCYLRPRAPMLVWSVLVGFVIWLAFESVLDSYYTWPVLALGILLAATAGWGRFAAATGLALFATWFSNERWQGIWSWWTLMMLVLVAIAVVAYPGGGALGRRAEETDKAGVGAQDPAPE